MLIVNAGAHKSGSTWVEAIIRRLPIDRTPAPEPAGALYPAIAARFAAAGMGQNRREKIAYVEWLSQHDIALVTHLVKCHISPGADRLKVEDFAFLANPHVRIVNVMRDIPDFLVSAFFHRKAFGKIDTLENFFVKQARNAFSYYVDYNHFWMIEAQEKGVKCPVVNLSYERLKEDFAAELARLARFLDIARPYSVERIARRTSMQRMQTKFRRKWMQPFGEGGKGFYRSGVVGGYKEHLTPAMIETVDAWRREEKCARLEAAREVRSP